MQPFDVRAPRRLGRIAISALVIIPLATGCQTTGGRQTVAADVNDICAVHRAGFAPPEEDRDRVAKVAGKALAGAAIGAVAGLMTGRGVSGALVGAAVGGAAGAVTGFVWLKIEDHEREKVLAERYGPANQYASTVDRAQVAFDQALACRRVQVAGLNADLRAKRIPRPAAEIQLAQIRVWQADDVKLAQQTLGLMTDQLKDQLTVAQEIKPGAVQAERSRAFSPYSAIVRADTAVRSSSSGTGTEGEVVRAGQVVRVAAVDQGWARVERGGRQIGYMRPTVLVREGAAKRYTAQADSPVLAAPDAAATETGRVGKGQSRQVTATLPGWVAMEKPNDRASRGFVTVSAMRGGVPVEGQAEGLLRATATNAQMTDAFGDSIAAANTQKLELEDS